MLLPLVAGCLAKAPGDAPEDDTDDDLGPAHTGDTGWGWGIDTDVGFGGDTFRVVDHPVGPTDLDGVWTGTFTLTAAVPLGRDGVAQGEVTFTIDGNAARHVVARFHADTWDPQVGGISRPYGPLDGIGFATLDPDDLSGFRLDVSLAARNMGTFSREGMRVRLVDDHLVIDFSNITGVGDFRVGHKLVADAVRSGGVP